MRRLIILGLLLVWTGLQADELKRVAVLDFVRVDSPGSHDPVLSDFSRAVQAHLLEDKGYAWVERQEFDRIVAEADPGAARSIDAATAVRLGRLLRADLLLRGEIVQKTNGAAELTVEALDLKRAEVLAARTVPMAMNARQKLHPNTAEVAAVTSAAQKTLTEACDRLARFKNVQVLAPLYFRNISTSDRLGFLEGRLQDALARATEKTTGVRILQFPRTGEAAEESSLVLAGLTDTDPDAWQKVADTYVWGSYKEEPVDGAVFDDVPVTVVLQVSNGSSERREVQWNGPVKNLTSGLEALAQKIVAEAQSLATRNAPTKVNERQLISAELAQRASEIERQITQGGTQFPTSNVGRQLYGYRVRLLEVACFFDPLNQVLQEDRLQAVWGGRNPFQPLNTLRGQWLRNADYQVQAVRFSRQADGTLDGKWPAARARNLRDFVNMLERATWKARETQVSPEEIHRQLGAIVALWSEVLAETHHSVLKEVHAPLWYAPLQAEWLVQADMLRTIRDPLIVYHALEKAWPVLEPEIGRLLKNDQSVNGRESLRWIEAIFSAYGALGDQDRATAMLDSAWRLGRANLILPTDKNKLQPTAPLTPVDLLWSKRPVAAPPSMERANPAFPILSADLREIDPRTIHTITRGRSVEAPLFQKNVSTTVGALAWQEGKLWISESNAPLPAILGPANPRGNDYLWRYDPALRSAELMTTQLGGHSTVSTLTPTADTLWLGFAADGVWSLDRGETIKRYKGEDGLQTMQIRSAAADQSDLFFLGGPLTKQLISCYSLKDGTWSGLQVPLPSPMPPWLATLPLNMASGQSSQLAVSGEWLCFSGLWTAFYNRSRKEWTDFHLGSVSPESFQGRYSAISADERGFWLADGNVNRGLVWFVDPAKPQERRLIALPAGSPKAIAHDGARLWILLDCGAGRACLALVNKTNFTSVGQIVLPILNASSLAAGNGRVWVGGAKRPLNTGARDGGIALAEVYLPPSGQPDASLGQVPGDFPLHRAIWTGDRAAVSAVLANQPELNATGTNGWTALMEAAAAGRSDLVRLLLDAGADPNLLSQQGNSALQQAVARGDLESARLLLDHGAKANLRPPVVLRGLLGPIRPRLEGPSLGAAAAPRQPVNLQATVTTDGEVMLSWDDQADNETHYEVFLKNSYGSNIVVASLPADSTQWIDPSTHDETELIYAIEARNGDFGAENNVKMPEARIKRPTPSKNVFRSRYGFIPGSSEVLPEVFVAQSPLSTAVMNGQAALAALLLTAGADPNQPDAAGCTPLMHAVRQRNYTLARHLLAHGARSELIAATGDSAALLTYQWHEDEQLLEELLRASPPDARAREASLLIGEAAALGQVKDIEKLQLLGGDLGDRVVGRVNPIQQALERNQVATARWIIKQRAPDLQSRFKRGALRDTERDMLVEVITRNDAETIGLLLDSGLGVDQFVDENPLLVIAAQKKAFAVLSLLRARGANLSLRSKNYEVGGRRNGTAEGYLTPEEVQRYLGSSTVEVREKSWPLPASFVLLSPGPTQYEWQPDPAKLELNASLVTACKNGNLPAVVQAAASGAELDCYGPDGRTPLLEALKAGAFSIVRWLVEEGASVNRPSKGGFSPVAFAVGSGKKDELEYLLQAGGDPNLFGVGGMPPLAIAAQSGNLEMIHLLLTAGANPNVSAYAHSRRENALTVGLWKGNAAVVDLLLANGANPRGQTYNFVGNTDGPGGITKRPHPSLLMFAATGRNLDLVKRLVSLGQNPRLQTGEGFDALAWAADTGDRSIVEYLLPLSERKGRALETAREKGHAEIVQMLETAGYQSL